MRFLPSPSHAPNILNKKRLSRRSIIVDRLFKVITGFLGWVAAGLFVTMALVLLVKGIGKVDAHFLLGVSVGAGFQGGIRYQILGTLILGVTAMIWVTPVATAIALTLVTVLKNNRLGRFCCALLHVLNSTPSILFGILGFIFFVGHLQWRKSWLAGSIILALMMLPTVSMSLIARLKTIPVGYVETAQSLGFTLDHTLATIYLPYGWGGLLTGLVMGVARACGETAPIMFTAVVFSGATLPSGIKDAPILALPYHIFNLIQDVYDPAALQVAWATALVLVVLVFALTALTIPFRAKSHEEAKI
jgi:phosphate transport system permease protein